MPPTLPRKLWMYWHQGWCDAPDVVKRCAVTWQKFNPTWDVHMLDATTISEKVELPPAELQVSLQGISSFIRICLLKKYGGVWADATLWCVRPLDDWIESMFAPGTSFFAYDKPRFDRPMSIWFLAIENRRWNVIKLSHHISIPEDISGTVLDAVYRSEATVSVG